MADETESDSVLAIAGGYGADAAGNPAPGGLHPVLIEVKSGVSTSWGGFAPGLEAGFIVASADRSRIYVVDERKNDGRGPVGPAATVRSYAVDAAAGRLEETGRRPVLGPFPTFLSLDPSGRWLAVASHGSFEHVERVVRSGQGWEIENVYDDSTVSLYPVEPDGTIGALADLVVLAGHGPDPSPTSAQAGRHPQASTHAHCAQFDPSGRFVVVCDKGTDRIHVYRLVEGSLVEAWVFQAAPGVAPRHAAFHPGGNLMVVSNELASTLTSYRFDPASGAIAELCTVSTLAPGGSCANEPADVQVHPDGRVRST